MANPATSTGRAENREHEKAGKSRSSSSTSARRNRARQCQRLRKGQGKLFTHVERIVGDLVEAGTVKSAAQPVVIVVREIPSPLSFFEGEDD